MHEAIFSVLPGAGLMSTYETILYVVSMLFPKVSALSNKIKTSAATTNNEITPPFQQKEIVKQYVLLKLETRKNDFNKRGTRFMGDGILGIFKEIVTLFVIIGVGYGAKKAHFMNEEFDRMLSRLVINLALPGMILGSVLTAETLPARSEILETLGIAFVSYIILFAIAYAFTLVLRIPDGHRGVYRFMLCFGNVGFIGYPVLNAIFGPEALIYAAIFNLPFNFFVFTVGAWFLTQDTDGDVHVKTTWRTFITPVMLACLLAMILALLGVHYAPILGDALSNLGSITTPAALLIIGSSLANLPVRDLIGGPRLWACAAFRLLVTPCLIWAAFHFFVPTGLLLSIAIVISGMPVATNGTMLCYQYGGNSRVMAQGTFVTTVLALVSIPLLVQFVQIVA